MRLQQYQGILNNEKQLTTEMSRLLMLYDSIEKTMSIYGTPRENIRKLEQDKQTIIASATEILQFVILNKINDINLIDLCISFLEKRKAFLANGQNGKTSESDLKKIEHQLENLDEIKRSNRKEAVNVNCEQQTAEPEERRTIEVPLVDESEMTLFKRFRHENSSLLYDNEGDFDMRFDESNTYRPQELTTIDLNASIIPTKPYGEKTTIPQELIVAKSMLSTGKGVVLNLKTGGNLLIETENERNDSELIDNFIVSYMFKIMEEFPLARAQFLILDKNGRWYYKKFAQNMNSGSANALCKSSAKTYVNSYELLDYLKGSKCDEIASKLDKGITNIYDLCEVDQDEALRFIILRDPIDSFASEDLAKVESLVKRNDTAHRCGYRFVIVTENDKSNTYNAAHLEEIKKNCQVRLKIDEESFRLEEELIKPLHIEGDVTEFIEEGTRELFDKLTKKGSSPLTADDVFAPATPVARFDSSIISIPVGKRGSAIVELPFSSANEDGTSEGAVVNYMVVGTTGSGKSSLMHSIIINGARKYSPDDLRFWIIDFKDGAESNKYRDADIPHIDLISSNNTQDDAIYILQMILEECERRNKLFSGLKDIHHYNQKMDKEKKPHLPQIIVIIDEAQELSANTDPDGYSDNISKLNNLIRETSSKIRAFGIHLCLIAQNISSGNSSYISSYLPQTLGRVAFTLDENALSESGFGTMFYNVRQDVARLDQGNAYVGLKDKLIKTRFAYIPDLPKRFKEIKKRHPNHEDKKTRIVGETAKLSPSVVLPYIHSNYYAVINNLDNSSQYTGKAVIGENSYSLSPFTLAFSPDQKSSLLVVGGSNKISTSIMKSIAMSLVKGDNEIHVVNGDKTSCIDADTNERLGNSLTRYCQGIGKLNANLIAPKGFKELLERIYREYKRRIDESSSSIDEIIFKPIYLELNDLSKLDCLSHGNMLFEDVSSASGDSVFGELKFNQFDEVDGNRFIDAANDNRTPEKGLDPISTINALTELIEEGYKQSIYVIASIVGSRSGSSETISDSFEKMIVYNDISKESIPNINGNQRKIFDMLKTIKNEGEETRALYVDNNAFIKVRPIVYEMTKEEREAEAVK